VVLFVQAGLAAPFGGRPPRWFAAASRPAELRLRRALVDGLAREEESPLFRQPLAEVIRRGFYAAARRLLLARATARRLGHGWSGRVLWITNPPTMRRAGEEAARFARLAPEGFRTLTWCTLYERIPLPARNGRPPALRASLADYLSARTVNRRPARLLDG
jgi:hypothetical protein